jgi:hypothetical protein
MAECEYCQGRAPSLSVVGWREAMGLPAECPLTPAQEVDVYEALLQADEDVALYAGWWPAPTAVCEEIPVAIRYGGCFFARAGLSRWVTLRFGKVQAVHEVQFLRRPGGCTPGVDCYAVAAGSICVVDGQYGSVELDDRAATDCGCPVDIERVRIRYVSGDGCTDVRFSRLLARYAATLLASPHLCGLDLRFAAWDSYTLTGLEQAEEVKYTEDDDGDWSRVTTTSTGVKTQEHRLPRNPRDNQSPFGPTRAGVQLWRYLKGRRRLRAYRL